jgi:hypothetical protein
MYRMRDPHRPKTILEYFESGKEIDAAVRRAVRKAVGPKSRRRKPRAAGISRARSLPRQRTSSEVGEMILTGKTIDAAVRRAIRAAVAATSLDKGTRAARRKRAKGAR